MSKHFYPVFLGLAVCGLGGTPSLYAAGPALSRFEYAQRHMGTQFQITLYAPDRAAADAAARAAFGRIADLDNVMSDYKPTSELMRLCKKAGGPPVPVSKDLFYVLSKAEEVSRLSDGAFDVTVGPVVRLWRRARRTMRMPDPEQLARARALVGYKMVHLDPKDRTVRLDKKGMLLDLGGIGKGFAADAALEVLKKHGITRALVAASGDIAAGDAPPGARGWKVGIGPLEDPNAPPKRYLLLAHAAVSTSGDFEQHVVINGKRYSHIVDPRTGIGLTGRRSVTIVAPKGIYSDSLTKVVSVLGPKKGFAIIESLKGVSSYVVIRTAKGDETFLSKGFPGLTAAEVKKLDKKP